MQGQSGFLSPRGRWRWRARSSPSRNVLGVWEEVSGDQDTSDCSSESWQVVASPLSHGPLARFLLRVTGRATPFAGGAFSPTPAPAQVTPSPFFLRVPAEETAPQAGLSSRLREKEVAGAVSRRQLMRMRAQLLFTSR